MFKLFFIIIFYIESSLAASEVCPQINGIYSCTSNHDFDLVVNQEINHFKIESKLINAIFVANGKWFPQGNDDEGGPFIKGECELGLKLRIGVSGSLLRYYFIPSTDNQLIIETKVRNEVIDIINCKRS